MEQYTSENCDKAQAIFDTLIDKLGELGENAPEKDKEKLFEIAIFFIENSINVFYKGMQQLEIITEPNFNSLL